MEVYAAAYTRRSAHGPGSTRVIVVHQISRRFGSTDAVSDLSFEVPPDCPCGFLGPNGAGKTTTLRIIVGALSADRGRVTICGRDVARDGAIARALVGYLPERCPLPPDLTVREWLAHRCGLWGMPRRDSAASVAEAIDLCALGAFERRLCGGLSRKTEVLVVGAYATESWKHSSVGNKILQASDWRDQGAPIAIVSEAHWTRHL